MTKKLLKKLKNLSEEKFAIHYSSEGLNDENDGISPRITSIVIKNIFSGASHSYSLHLEADVKNILKKDVKDNYDELEKEMIANCYNFMRKHENAYWLHWNMNSIHYGFEAIAHRFRVLGGDVSLVPEISDRNKINIFSLIAGIYGYDCVGHPKMEKLMLENGEIHRDYLSGKDEAKAFEDEEYVKLHRSTLTKVNFFVYIYNRLQKGKVNVTNKNWLNRIDSWFETLTFKILGLISIIMTIIGGVYKWLT